MSKTDDFSFITNYICHYLVTYKDAREKCKRYEKGQRVTSGSEREVRLPRKYLNSDREGNKSNQTGLRFIINTVF